jgi:acetoin utilization deacetylase AcuC-like enzyme
LIAAQLHKADVILVAGGADGHSNDPLSTLQYTEAGFRRAGELVGAYARANNVPVIFGGAGGYLPDSDTPESWVAAATGAADAMSKASVR